PCWRRQGSWSIAVRSRTSPAGRPVTMATSAGPCDSPAVVRVSASRRRLWLHRGAHDVERGRDARPALERGGPLADERLESVHDDATAGAARLLDERRCPAVGPVGEVDDGLLRRELDEQLVLDR